MKKRLWISRITACGLAATLAFSPAIGSLVVRSFAAENTEDVPGIWDDSSLNVDVPGKAGDGSLTDEVPGKAGDGSGVGDAEPVEASGNEDEGSLTDEVPGKEGDDPVVDDTSEGSGDDSDAFPAEDPDGYTYVVEPSENNVPVEMTAPAKYEPDSEEEEEPEEDEDEEEEDEEYEENEEDSEDDSEEEEAEEEEDSEEEESEEDGGVLSPEQQAALDDEDAVQAEQAYDYYESYDPWLFAYENYWRGWKQGQSAWYSMRNYGCRMVAYSKLLRASGVVKPGNFSPDDFFLWCRENGWLLGTIREIGTPGNCMMDYAASKGYSMIREESISMFKSADPEARKQEIIDKINEGYYVILCSSAHFVYVDDLRTRITQELWVDDSINGENVYKVDRYVFQGSLADWENADARKNWHYRCFKLEEAEDAFEEDDEYDTPRVLSAEVSAYDEESGVYTIEAKVNKQPYNLDRVMFPTWADNDHTDLPANWEYGTGFNGTRGRADAGEGYSVWTFDVNLNDHDNATGNYYTYIYVYDKYGNRSAPFTLTVTVE